MRLPSVLISTALLLAPLTACADDVEPVARPDRTTAPSSTSTPMTLPSPSATPAPSATPTRSRAVRLTGDGVDTPTQLVEFGTPYDQARPTLDAALGTPTKDSGPGPVFGPYGTCPGTTLHALEYGDGALVLLFGNVDGAALTLYQWALDDRGTPMRVPRASALIGDAATVEFGVGTTVAELSAAAGAERLEVQPGSEVVDPYFRLRDQSAGFLGSLTGTGASDLVTSVQAGTGCGE